MCVFSDDIVCESAADKMRSVDLNKDPDVIHRNHQHQQKLMSCPWLISGILLFPKCFANPYQ